MFDSLDTAPKNAMSNPPLPASPTSPPRAGGPGGDGANAAKGRILVVDDDRLVLATVVHGLVQAGYEVIDADNGDDAILAARRQLPDLALLDIRMEGKSGFDVAAYLRDHLQVPFIFLSAFNDAHTAEQVRELGAIAYLVKPLEIGQIVPTVDAAFARLRGGGAAVPSASAGAVTVQAPHDVVAIALGILMHRFSLPRREAFERLRRQALQESRALDEQALRVVEAVELLAASGGDG